MDEETLQFWRNIAIKMMEQVEKAIFPLIGKPEAGTVVQIGADGTPSKLIDLIAEDEVIEVLKETKKPIILISEEIGTIKINYDEDYLDIEELRNNPQENINLDEFYSTDKSQIIFLVDPLDGTSNAVKNIPSFGISIAIAEHKPGDELPSLKDIQMGFIKNFATGDVYETVKGKYALINGEPANPSNIVELNKASLGAFIYGTKFSKIHKIVERIRRMRILGSVAIELAYVGTGNYDAFIDIRGNIRIMDIAAAQLFVKESGGVISDNEGNFLNGSLTLDSRTSIVATGTDELHDKILELMDVI